MTDLVKRLEATRTEGLAEKLKALREKATPGPWEVHALEWTAWTGNAMKDHAIRTAWIHGQLKDHAAVVGLSRRSAKDGPETGLWISPDDAALIIELVNNLDTIISALSGDGMVMVPREPTEEMIASGWRGFQGSGRGTTAIWHAYRAMVRVAQRRSGQ